MAAVNPPLHLTLDDVYTGADLGRPFRDLIAEGVVGAGDLEVSAGSGLSVDVAAGSGWVLGLSNPDVQPIYRVRNDATLSVALEGADGSNPRLDAIVAEVRDSAFSGSQSDFRIYAIAGTPAPSPGIGTLPDNHLLLATVTVPAGASTIDGEDIVDYRNRAYIGGGAAALKPSTDYLLCAKNGPIAPAEDVWEAVTEWSTVDDAAPGFDDETGVYTVPTSGLWSVQVSLYTSNNRAVSARLLEDTGAGLQAAEWMNVPAESAIPAGISTSGVSNWTRRYDAGDTIRLDVTSGDNDTLGILSFVGLRVVLLERVD